MSLPLLVFPKIAVGQTSPIASDDWVATEKIHGAQLVLGVEGDEVRFGKRKAWLEAEDAFFGWQMLRPELRRAAQIIYAELGRTGRAWIYGELFGGQYPHPDVPSVPSLTAVQTGIWYAADLRYAVFDIVHESQTGAVFLGHDRVRELTQRAELLSPPVLGRGGRSELQRLPVRFASNVPRLLGLPAIAGNVAEGFVLKPAIALPVTERPCIKHKVAEFDEQRFDESQAFDANRHLSLEELQALARRLMNPARLASARSKVGLDTTMVVEEAVLDALIDLRDMLPRRIEALDDAEETILLETLRQSASSV